MAGNDESHRIIRIVVVSLREAVGQALNGKKFRIRWPDDSVEEVTIIETSSDLAGYWHAKCRIDSEEVWLDLRLYKSKSKANDFTIQAADEGEKEWGWLENLPDSN